MNLLLSFAIGVLTGLLLTGRNDSFIGSLRKWINETSKDSRKKREEIEETIEKTLAGLSYLGETGGREKKSSQEKDSLFPPVRARRSPHHPVHSGLRP